MAIVCKDDLAGEYNWNDIAPDDPRVSGTPDDTPFNARNGHEVLYLINALMNEWDLLNVKSGHKMERMLNDLPSEIQSQAEAKQWIKDKWSSYRFKVAKGKAVSSSTRQTRKSTQTVTLHSKDHHYCASCRCVTESKVVQPDTNNPLDTPAHGTSPAFHSFKRVRKCTSCNTEFETMEVNAELLSELMRLRSLVDNFMNDLEANSNRAGTKQK